ncbi:hypothetical protein LQ954_14935 [Sphingomonas sp. IC-11]|uniref:hypothetical protein n=1 Tax=Sphingomonas sp. IC-11 TaxID=2898528 RepID=UPI001E60A695|nr:hypothetical protein [Sphingomonas sp. IC-11]MCD2317441.1 hypothetical protein [Sphingomonas sp. IC-11]
MAPGGDAKPCPFGIRNAFSRAAAAGAINPGSAGAPAPLNDKDIDIGRFWLDAAQFG